MSRLPIALAVLALLATSPGFAADAATASCKLFAKQQWTDKGTRSIDDCLALIDNQPVDRSAEGNLRFGSWGDVMLAADLSLYYRSDNGGADWTTMGSKQHAIDPATLSSRVVQPVTPRTDLPAQAYVPPPQPVPLVLPSASDQAAASAKSAGDVDAYAKLGIGKEDNNRCELMMQRIWRMQPQSSLEECARTMEFKGSYDRNGQLRAYWGSIYLTADSSSVYVSKNGSDWLKLRERK